MNDLPLYEETEKQIGYISVYNKDFIDIINSVINTDFFVSSQIQSLHKEICEFASALPEGIRVKAKFALA